MKMNDNITVVTEDANVSLDNNVDDNDDDKDVNVMYVSYYLGMFLVLAVINLGGNSLVLLTIARHRSLWLPSNVFICR